MNQQQQRRRGPVILLVVLAVGIAVVDQVTKYLAEDRLTPGVVVPLVGDVLGLQLIYNPGAAFSIATGMTWVFTVITVVVVVVVLRVSRRLRSAGWAVALGMLLGGALGNLYDRLLREPGFARGHVVDFINYNGWFVGNVADIAIVAAAVLIALLALRGIEVDGTRVPEAAVAPEAQPGGPPDEEDLGEEPLGDETDFTAEVPRASGEDVDVADWVAGAPSAGATGTGAQGATEPRPAEPATEPRPAEPAAPEAAEQARPAGASRRPRSRSEARPAGDDDA